MHGPAFANAAWNAWNSSCATTVRWAVRRRMIAPGFFGAQGSPLYGMNAAVVAAFSLGCERTSQKSRRPSCPLGQPPA